MVSKNKEFCPSTALWALDSAWLGSLPVSKICLLEQGDLTSFSDELNLFAECDIHL